MSEPIYVFFDYVDPLFFAAEALAQELEGQGHSVERISFELRPPPMPLMATTDPDLEWRRAEAVRRSPKTALVRANLIPWTRKAHELALHAQGKGSFLRVHSALAEAHLSRARDIGRVDVLLEIAVDCGLDWSETKAVLDVDRFTAELEASREKAIRLGVQTVPTFVIESHRLEGIPDLRALDTLLTQPGQDSSADEGRPE